MSKILAMVFGMENNFWCWTAELLHTPRKAAWNPRVSSMQRSGWLVSGRRRPSMMLFRATRACHAHVMASNGSRAAPTLRSASLGMLGSWGRIHIVAQWPVSDCKRPGSPPFVCHGPTPEASQPRLTLGAVGLEVLRA